MPAVPARLGKGMMPSAGTGGQSTSGTPKVRLLSGHGPPRPGGLAAGRDQPVRGLLWITRGQPVDIPRPEPRSNQS